MHGKLKLDWIKVERISASKALDQEELLACIKIRTRAFPHYGATFGARLGGIEVAQHGKRSSGSQPDSFRGL
jgi:hypothetical protein